MADKTYDSEHHCYSSLKKQGIILDDTQKFLIKQEFDNCDILKKQVRESNIKKLLKLP